MMEKVTFFKNIKDINVCGKHLLVVSDVVYKIFQNSLDERFNNIIIINENNDSDSVKCFENVEKIINELINLGLNKDDTLICFGGGAISDLTNFVSSIYKRGIKFINIPTTLLSMVDSSIGGKNAINFKDIKNVIGTIKLADEVIICEEIINSFTQSILEYGLGEIFKYYFLDESFSESDLALESIFETIKKSISYKQKIVELDLNDDNIRMVLNLGHSIGHALEREYKLPHGIAVIEGIYFEHWVLNKLDIVSDEVLFLILNMKDKLNIRKREYNFDIVCPKIGHDKKVRNNMLTIPYITNKNQYDFITIDIKKVSETLSTYEF